MRANAIRLSVALVLVSCTVAFASLSGDAGGLAAGSRDAPGNDPQLRAHARIGGLYPGAVKTMNVRVRNGYASRVRLTWIKTHAQNASPGCSHRNLRVERLRRTAIKIPSHARRRLPINVRMVGSAPDTCQGARFPLRFELEGRGR
jgi:hypothetical protein